MATKGNTRRFGRRESEVFNITQYIFQPANCWFVEKPEVPEDLESFKVKRPKKDGDITQGLLKKALPGSGTVVAVLDTGIQYGHLAFRNHEMEFEDKVILQKNFIDPTKGCEDHNGHGTECAGIACGLSFSGIRKSKTGEGFQNCRFNSFAPGAKLVVCKVGDNDIDDEVSSVKAITDALKYIVVYNKEQGSAGNKVDVISISFGYERFNKQLAMAIHEAISNDIIVVCCASNDGRTTQNPITYPSRLGHVLCIGACDKFGHPAKFSSVGKEVDFVALGENVWVPSTDDSRNDVVKVLDGTSFSTPAVVGLICCLLQDIKRISTTYHCPEIYKNMHNVWCMRELLKSMSSVRGHHDNAFGYGKLQPLEYIKKGDDEKMRICKEISGTS